MKLSNPITSKLKDLETPYNDILCDFDAYRKIQSNNNQLAAKSFGHLADGGKVWITTTG